MHIAYMYNTDIYTNMHTVDTVALTPPLCTQNLTAQVYTWEIHRIWGIKLLTHCWKWVWLGRSGCISCRMRDGTWGGFITQTGLTEPSALCQPDSKLFYASGALIFHTVSSHDSPFPQRKIAGMKKRRTPCDRLVHCATEFRLQAEGDEGRGRARREGEWGWRQCTAGRLHVSLTEVNMDL